MSRELYRVPLDFEWPMKTTWSGYLMSDDLTPAECQQCGGSGSSPVARMLKNRWYGYVPFKPEERGSMPLTIDHPGVRAFAERNVAGSPEYYGSGERAVVWEAQRLAELWNGQWCHHLNQDDVDALVAEGRLMDLTHTWTREARWQPKVPAAQLTAAEVNDWSLHGLGHDSINHWIVVKAECARLGVANECANCSGEGHIFRDDEHKAVYDGWERAEPPRGDGYQMWETTSEGSPISPVFGSAEELAHWLADTGASAFGSDTATFDQWLKMIGVGSTPGSAVMVNGGPMMSAVTALSL